jgi:hypothetical protein
LALAFVRPRDVSPPRFLGQSGEASFAVAYTHGDCASAPATRRYRWSVASGGEQVIYRPILGSGVHCLRVWAFDELGRRSKTPSTLTVDVKL